jgi:hypothetical protein
MDHSDFAHYTKIMCHPEHFENVFSIAFECLDDLQVLLDRIRDLRARSHHPGEFTPEDSRDLRLSLRTLEKGLVNLLEDYELEFRG